MTDSAPLRVAFTHISRRLWTGGHNYQNNLFAALGRHCPGKITPVMFAGIDDDPLELAATERIAGVEVVKSSAFAAFDRRRSGLVAAVASGIDRAAAIEFKATRIDLVFEAARFFGWRLPFPTLAWFPDFQHRRLPELFSRPARWQRDLGFRVQIASGRRIMLSSESALRDCRRFYPRLAGQVSVVRFATQPTPEFLTAHPPDVLAHYGLPPKFCFLPNQFWRHKNHQVVVDALTILRKRGCDVVIAATGSAEDPREPHYFNNFMTNVQNSGLEMNFRYLGMIPLEHVYALMRTTTALINPSSLEGWSTTVEEAKSFGVPMILSDIDVHREQTRGTARYFDINDANSLAHHLSEISQPGQPPRARSLSNDLDVRVRIFAEEFIGAVRNALS